MSNCCFKPRRTERACQRPSKPADPGMLLNLSPSLSLCMRCASLCFSRSYCPKPYEFRNPGLLKEARVPSWSLRACAGTAATESRRAPSNLPYNGSTRALEALHLYKATRRNSKTTPALGIQSKRHPVSFMAHLVGRALGSPELPPQKCRVFLSTASVSLTSAWLTWKPEMGNSGKKTPLQPLQAVSDPYAGTSERGAPDCNKPPNS